MRRCNLVVLGLVACCSVFAARKSLAAEKPNVLIILSDDQGYGDLSCHGNPLLKTPNLDKLHDEAVRFVDFHVTPMCTPTRGQLMSGMDALRNGATSVTYGRAMLRKGLPTLADAFRTGGYKTGLFGKWHLGDMYPYRPIDRGFDESVYFLGFGLMSAPEFDNDYFDCRYLHNGQPAGHFQGYSTDYWFTSAMDWMKQRQSAKEPFFIYLPTNTPHGPNWVDPKYSDPYQKGKGTPATFFGMVANLDENMGRLEKFLDEAKLKDNTIVVFMSDNGGTGGGNIFNDGGAKFFNAGMRGMKKEYYEGGHRVPCFVRWPDGKLRPSGDVAGVTQVQDIYPTLLDLAGVATPPAARLDGTSLAKVLKDPTSAVPDRTLVVQYGQSLDKGQACVMHGSWRLVHNKELYDLKSDPGQKTDVAARHPEIVKQLADHYESWWGQIAPHLDDYCPISIGSAQQPTVELASADWQDVYCDSSPSVREGKGGSKGGPWNVYVEQDGQYEIALGRYPLRTGIGLADSAPATKVRVSQYPAGKAFPIAKARLKIGDQDLTMEADPHAPAAVFQVTLKAGVQTQLHGWFQNAKGKDLCGAYYATVTRK